MPSTATTSRAQSGDPGSPSEPAKPDAPATPGASAGGPIVVPPGLAGVSVTDTSIGHVRGREGFYHYRQYSAVDLAERRTVEDVWHLLFSGELPDSEQRAEFTARLAAYREVPAGVRDVLPAIAAAAPAPLDGLRTALSLAGAAQGMRPMWDLDEVARREDALRLCAQVPTLLTALHRLARGEEPIPPRPDLPYAANYLFMLTGTEPRPEHSRAIERYLVSTIDHGFNASTFTARVIASTGADVAACLVGAVGALSGPLHGGAPSRALDALDAIGTPDRIDAWVRDRIENGERIMGFGHPVYRTEDPRSRLLRRTARELGGDLVEFATAVESRVLALLAELKPDREIHTNVEFYAGVVMELCGLPRTMFTPTFASSRVIGWSAHVLEQARDRKIIRPDARYVGTPPPQPVPEI
ncbi:citrate synthase/methylcitrate synthase [Actinopolymorpha rutila]|uniref:Citrate synthase n=1 Tax=Actinopolymorpha rutila TaxID=446787 RepID=A0A852ZGW2_9ACTN|nr:citrate synthase/methylcitrate synthase [Actinopolymorpha rutila]NYH88839.1 citrate synthase [Actinopolymorpha rutila]